MSRPMIRALAAHGSALALSATLAPALPACAQGLDLQDLTPSVPIHSSAQPGTETSGSLQLKGPPTAVVAVSPTAGGRQNPLSGVNFGPPAHLRKVEQVDTGPFCDQAHKAEWLSKTREEINDATWNASQWSGLRHDLVDLQLELQLRVAERRELADEAQKRGDRSAEARLRAQVAADRVVLAELAKGIAAADREIAIYDANVEGLQKALEMIKAARFKDCGPPSSEFIQQSRRDVSGAVLEALNKARTSKPVLAFGEVPFVGAVPYVERPFDGSEAEFSMRDQPGWEFFDESPRRRDRRPKVFGWDPWAKPAEGAGPAPEVAPNAPEPDTILDLSPVENVISAAPPPVVEDVAAAAPPPPPPQYPRCPTDGMPATPEHIREFHS